MNKKSLSACDICTKFAVTALQPAGWDIQHQVREEHFFTAGQVLVKGKTVRRGKRKFADFLLSLKPNMPLALIEARDNNHSIGSGMCDALEAKLTTTESASAKLFFAAVHLLAQSLRPQRKSIACPA